MAQDFAAAVHHFTKGLALDARNEVFWSNRSAAHCSLKEYEKALEDAGGGPVGAPAPHLNTPP